MTFPELWHSGWTAALFNHLWQSTVVSAAAWFLTLLLRQNAARLRYAVWMLASLKFLVPFSLLSNLGAHWTTPIAGKTVGSALYTAADEIGQPFRPSLTNVAHPALATNPGDWTAQLPAVLFAIWFSGFLFLSVTWIVRWMRMARIARQARPIEEGREAEALRRAGTSAGSRTLIPMRILSQAIEPGVFGILRPVLLWPEGISAQLDDAQVASVVAHEIEHVRRRDNLTAAIHMFVEALFWFHPAVRWMGSRLMDERERACDERVLQLSARPETYAESILKVCAFCVEPPVPCVSGVSGADLKQRIMRIMTHRPESPLNALRRCALYAAGIAAIAFPLGFGVLHALQTPTQLVHPAAGLTPAFEIVTIKPNHEDSPMRRIGMSPGGFIATHASLKDLLGIAYDVRGEGQLIGGPGWMDSEYFDIDAKMSDTDVEAAKKLPPDQRRAWFSHMLQSMLADRFAFKATIETRELPVYALVVAKGGPKMKLVEVDPPPADGTAPSPGAHVTRMVTHDGREWNATGFPLGEFAHWLSHFEELGNRIVVDETGLTGNYDFVLRGVSVGSQFQVNKDAPQDLPESIFSALPEQMGLKLESRRAPVEVLVVDHAEPPSPN